MKRQLLLTLILIFTTANCFGQKCSCISGTRDKKTGVESRGGITTSDDYYSLLFQKETNYKDSTVSPKFSLLLNAASRVVFPDSIVGAVGKIELLLSNNSKLNIENARYFNNPMPFGFCIAVSVNMTKGQLEIISKYPIATFTTLPILTTKFAVEGQKKQQKIITCLLME